MKKLLLIIAACCTFAGVIHNEPAPKKKSKEAIYLDAAQGLMYTYFGIWGTNSAASLFLYHTNNDYTKKALSTGHTLIFLGLMVHGLNRIKTAYKDLEKVA